MEAPTLESLLTVVGLSAIVPIVVQVIVTAWQPDAATKQRFGPLLSVTVGVVLAVAAAFLTNNNVGNAVLLGILVGWTGSGMYDTIRGVVRPG